MKVVMKRNLIFSSITFLLILLTLSGCRSQPLSPTPLLSLPPLTPSNSVATSPPASTPAPPPKLARLAIVQQNNRPEYVDVAGQTVAYWDSQAGRLRLLSLELSDKDTSLFHGMPAEQVSMLLPSAPQKSEAIRFPFPFNPQHAPFRAAEFQSGNWRLFGFAIPRGTPFYAPVPGQATRGFSPAVKLKRANVQVGKSRFSLGFAFVDANYVMAAEPVPVQLGDVLFYTSAASRPIPVHQGGYQVTLSGGSPAGPFSLSWHNLLRDEIGRFIYVSDAP